VVAKEVAVVKAVGDAVGGEAVVGGELGEVELAAPDVGYVFRISVSSVLYADWFHSVVKVVRTINPRLLKVQQPMLPVLLSLLTKPPTRVTVPPRELREPRLVKPTRMASLSLSESASSAAHQKMGSHQRQRLWLLICPTI
jgi:hypothetical protein